MMIQMFFIKSIEKHNISKMKRGDKEGACFHGLLEYYCIG